MASLRRATFAGETIFSYPLSKGEPAINQNKRTYSDPGTPSGALGPGNLYWFPPLCLRYTFSYLRISYHSFCWRSYCSCHRRINMFLSLAQDLSCFGSGLWSVVDWQRNTASSLRCHQVRFPQSLVHTRVAFSCHMQIVRNSIDDAKCALSSFTTTFQQLRALSTHDLHLLWRMEFNQKGCNSNSVFI